MSKSGVLGTLLPVLGGVAALGTGLGAAGIGPLAGLFSAGDAAGAAAGAGAAAEGVGAAGAGSLSEFAPAFAGEDLSALGSSLGVPVGDAGAAAAGAGSLGSGLGAAAPALASSLGGLAANSETVGGVLVPGIAGDVGAEVPTATSLTGSALPTTSAVDFSGGVPGGATPSAAVAAGDPLTAAGGSGGDVPGGNFSSSGSSFTDWFKNPKNLLSVAPLALLGGEALFGGNQVPGSGPVTAAAQSAATEAGTLTGQGTQNQSYVNTGALPAGAQAAIDQAANAAKAEVRSSYAGMGVPAGSTMEAEALGAVDKNAAAQKLAIQMDLLKQGVNQAQVGVGYSAQNISAQEVLMEEQIAQNNALMQALANFSGSFA